jgi:hypothetical protein
MTDGGVALALLLPSGACPDFRAPRMSWPAAAAPGGGVHHQLWGRSVALPASSRRRGRSERLRRRRSRSSHRPAAEGWRMRRARARGRLPVAHALNGARSCSDVAAQLHTSLNESALERRSMRSNQLQAEQQHVGAAAALRPGGAAGRAGAYCARPRTAPACMPDAARQHRCCAHRLSATLNRHV